MSLHLCKWAAIIDRGSFIYIIYLIHDSAFFTYPCCFTLKQDLCVFMWRQTYFADKGGLAGKASRADIIKFNKYFKYGLMNMVGGCRQLSNINH